MKARALVSILILLLAVLIIAGSCATRKKAISEEDFFEAYSSSWVNTDYVGNYYKPQKTIRLPDGTWEDYIKLTDADYACYGKHTITDMWTDSKGNVWYRARWECLAHSAEGNAYGKISDSGNTLERLMTVGERKVEEWDPDRFEYIYTIYYRQ